MEFFVQRKRFEFTKNEVISKKLGIWVIHVCKARTAFFPITSSIAKMIQPFFG